MPSNPCAGVQWGGRHGFLFYLACFVVFMLYLAVGMLFYHFAENWNVLEALYFSVSLISTVGYGDYVPTKLYVKVVTGFYMLGGVFLFAYAFSILAETIIHKHEKTLRNIAIGRQSNPNAPWRKGVFAAIAMLLVVFVGSLFYGLYRHSHVKPGVAAPQRPSNGWDAVYFAVITAGTVGYGDENTGDTSGGQVFAIFYMLLAVPSLALAIKYVAELLLDLREADMIRKLIVAQRMAEQRASETATRVNLEQFVAHKLLQRRHCTRADIDSARAQFQQLDRSAQGFINTADAPRFSDVQL